MKRTNSFRLKALLTLLVSCLVTAHATTVDVDGITYYISNNKASVAYKSDGTQYSGDIVIPDSIPCDGTNYPVTGMTSTSIFSSCPELTSLTFGANFMNGSYSFDDSYSLKSVTFNYVHPRSITVFGMTFRYCQSLETVALPSSTKTPSKITLADEMFHGCTNLKAISNLPSDISYQIGVMTFYGCRSLNPLEFIDLSGATFLSSDDRRTVATAAFARCNISSVTIPETMTEIPNATFYGCPLTEVTIPSTVTHIGAQAFQSESYTVATPVLHEGLKYIGDNAFLGVENLNIPSTLETLGILAGSSRLKSATVAEGNKYFEVKNNALYQNKYSLNDSGEEVLASKTLRNVIAGNGYTGPSVWKEEDELVTAIGNYAFRNIPVTGYDIPNLRSIGSAAFYESAIEKVTIKKDIYYGFAAFGNCIKLNEVTIEDGVKSLPESIFRGCSNLTTFPSLPRSITALNSGQEFYNCGFTHVTLHPGMETIKYNTFSRKVTDIECMSMIPPAIDGYVTFSYEGSGYLYLPEVTLTVPQESIELYKQHEVWGQCKEIKGNPDWAGFDGTTAALPGGLYIAHKGGNILYKQNGTTYDTGIPAGAHPFQMQIYNDAIYVADAGESYYYSETGAYYGTGDGMLYKVEYTGDAWVKTPMLVPNGAGCDFGDPYTCFIDKTNGDIYAANRSMGVYKFNANDKNWYLDKLQSDNYYGNSYNDNLYLTRHNWLDYYGAGIVYGAHIRGFHRDSNGLNWMLCSFNGPGIFRFKDSDIHRDGRTNPTQRPYGIVASDLSAGSAMYIDEANGYLYLFSRYLSKYGLYRIALSSISDSGDSYFVNNTAWELIDDSPASPENNTADEGVHVRQITGDGNYIYWSYIAEEGSGLKSGIKMIPATGTPTVSYLSEDIEVYGLAVKDFDPAGMEQIALDGTTPALINVAGKSISASGDVTVTVYSISGAVELSVEVAAGGSVALDGLGNGMYIIRATAADGTTQAVKAVI